MADYDNTGAFWLRKPKEDDEAGKKYPNYDGQMTVDGKKKYLALWVNADAKDKSPNMSFKINEPLKKE